MISRRDTITFSPEALAFAIGLIALNWIPLMGSKAALIYLAAMAALVFWQPQRILDEGYATAAIWVMIGWCLLSFLWSNYPSQTIRHGLQLALTASMAVAAGLRLSTTTVLRVLLVTGLILAVCQFGIGRISGSGAWLGLYNSKNQLAQFAMIPMLVGLAITLDRRGRRYLLPGVVALVAGTFLLIVADSVGAILAAMGACTAMVAIKFLNRLGPWQRLLVAGSSVLLIALIAIAVSGFFDELSQLMVRLTGKDLTLTGRTTLWQSAFDEIAKHPLLGEGFRGVWVVGNPLAERLWAEFGIADKVGFHFHNTFISNTVEIGLIGGAMQLGLFLYTLYFLVLWAIRSPSFESLFWAGYMVREVILVNSEVMFFAEFAADTVLMFMAIVVARRYQLSLRAPAPRSGVARTIAGPARFSDRFAR